MNEQVQKYVRRLEKEKIRIEGEIALKKRALAIVLERMSDPEFHLAKELKRGAVKVSKELGLEPIKKPKTVLKKNPDVLGASEKTAKVPAPGQESGQEKKEEKKSTWSMW